MPLITDDEALLLSERIDPKYATAFEGLCKRERAALALYFLPHSSKKRLLGVTRPRVVKWYCPFADQRAFPSGHRYCINVYAGCEHACVYCYAASYVNMRPHCKRDFRHLLMKDLNALDTYDVPPAPVHISNSTDPLQSLELQHRDTLFTLEKLAERRHRFTTVTLLTKNPAMLANDQYVEVLRRLGSLSADHPRRAWFDQQGYPALRLECSLAFYNDQHRQVFDPDAPSVEGRMKALRFLQKAGIATFIRIDPLFPRNPLLGDASMTDFGVPDVQPKSDLLRLIDFATEIHAGHIIYSVAKITQRKAGGLSPIMAKMKRVYTHLAGHQPLIFRGGSWRLPTTLANALVVQPFLKLCQSRSLPAIPCKTNLFSTR